MKYLIICLLFFGLSLANTFAKFYDLNLGMGLTNESPGRYQTDKDGDKSLFNNRFTLEAEGSYRLGDSETWNLHGTGGLLWPGGEVDYISRQVYYLNSTVGYMMNPHWELRLGGGFYLTRISGDGGTTRIRNGAGFTNFPIPEEASISRNVTLNAASNFEFIDDVSFRVETFIFNPVNSRNRTFNIAFTLRYHFGDSLWRD